MYMYIYPLKDTYVHVHVHTEIKNHYIILRERERVVAI